MKLFHRRSGNGRADISRIQGAPLAEAAMAAAALLVARQERGAFVDRGAIERAVEGMIPSGAPDGGRSVDLFNRFVLRIRHDPERGREEALAVLAGLAGDGPSAGAALRAGCAVARSLGGLTAAQTEELRALAARLGAPDDLDESVLAEGSAGRMVITLGNEKGGTGKSTIAMHIAVALQQLGYEVGCIDIDGRQGTLSSYLGNRRAFALGGGQDSGGQDIAVPACRRIRPSRAADRAAARAEDRESLRTALAELSGCRIVVIDTPGSDGYLSRLAHANADLVVTPLNDTFLDVDVLARIDREKRQVVAPSVYSEMVLEQKDRRLLAGREPFEWIVMRNRVTHVDSRNKREIIALLGQLGERLGYRLTAAFGERVVFHELFLSGLTLLDLPDDSALDRNYGSHCRACAEFRELLLEIGARV